MKLGFTLKIKRHAWFIEIPSSRGDCGDFPQWTVDYHAPHPSTVMRHTRYILKWFWIVDKQINPGAGSWIR